MREQGQGVRDACRAQHPCAIGSCLRKGAEFEDLLPERFKVELRGRIGVYEARGELQLIVEAMRRLGTGTLYEEFLRLRARLEQQADILRNGIALLAAGKLEVRVRRTFPLADVGEAHRQLARGDGIGKLVLTMQ